MPLAALVLAWPLAEIAVLILVGSRVGVWPVLGWLALAAVLGTWLIRLGGRQAASGLQAALSGSPTPTIAAAGGAAGGATGGAVTVFAGLLLILPGLLSDAAALVLLLPPVQRRVARSFTAGGMRVGGLKFDTAGMVWRAGSFAEGRNVSAAVIDGEYEVLQGKTVSTETHDPESPSQRAD